MHDVKWDPGLRFGLGWNDVCDGWDFLVNWTYYHTVEKEKVRVPIFEVPVPYDFGVKGLMNPWISQSFKAGFSPCSFNANCRS